MTEYLLPVEGVATSANTFDDIIEALALKADAATQGVVRGKLNALAVTGTSSPVAVASGWAIVNGKLYRNSASKNITISTPATNPRIDLIVLRLDYTASPMTCVAAQLAGTAAASPVAPTPTQTDGTLWELPIAQVAITTGGVITVTDQRAYIGDGHVATASIAAAAVTEAKLAASVAGNGLTGGAGTPLAVGAGTAITVTADAVAVTAGGIGTTQLAADAVDDTIAGNRVPRLTARQGNSATIWGGASGAGANNYTPTMIIEQAGMAGATITGTSGSFQVTFPTAFGYAPLVLLTPGNPIYNVGALPVAGSTTTKFELFWQTIDGSSASGAAFVCAWLAIGPEVVA
jgi:hypothetical protein